MLSPKNRRRTSSHRLSLAQVVNEAAEILEDRSLLTPGFSFDFTSYAGSLDTSKFIFAQPTTDASPSTIIYFGEATLTSLTDLPNTLAAVNGDPSRLRLEFGTADVSNFIEVLSLAEFDDGTTDGEANQKFVENGALEVGGQKVDDPQFRLFNGDELVATGRLVEVNIETNQSFNASSSSSVFQFDAAAPAGADPTIHNELVAASLNASGAWEYSLGTFNFIGPLAGISDVEEFSSSGQSLFPDGQIDFGDAPDSYGTTAASGGPQHKIIAGLSIGNLVDGEADGVPGAAANSDSLGGVNDEFELGTIRFSPTANAALEIAVSNSTGSNATLYGWVDFNGNGTFDSGTERASVFVPSSSGLQTVSLDFGATPSNAAVGPTYVRLRLSSDAAAASPTGIAQDGEVEDYRISIVGPGNIDGNDVFDANDSFLIHLTQLSGSNNQIDQSKGSSSLSASEIRSSISSQLQLPGDVDGDGDFDANDSFLIHLVQLSATTTQVEQSKGSSLLTGEEISNNVRQLMGGGSDGSLAKFDGLAGNQTILSDYDSSKLFVAVNDTTAELVSVDTDVVDQAYSSDGFRDWIQAI